MKQSFAAWSFRANTFSGGNWTGIGIDILVGYPAGNAVAIMIYVPGTVCVEIVY